MVAIYIVERGD